MEKQSVKKMNSARTISEIRRVNVIQPALDLLLAGVKDIENRTKPIGRKKDPEDACYWVLLVSSLSRFPEAHFKVSRELLRRHYDQSDFETDVKYEIPERKSYTVENGLGAAMGFALFSNLIHDGTTISNVWHDHVGKDYVPIKYAAWKVERVIKFSEPMKHFGGTQSIAYLSTHPHGPQLIQMLRTHLESEIYQGQQNGVMQTNI